MTTFERALTRANGRPVPMLTNDDAPAHGLPRPVLRVVYDQARDEGFGSVQIVAGNLPVSLVLGYAESSGIAVVVEAAKQIRQGLVKL